LGPWSAELDEARRKPQFIDQRILANGGLFLAIDQTGPKSDSLSLEELRAAVEPRGRRALELRQAALTKLESGGAALPSIVRTHYELGNLYTHEGRLDEAAASFEKALELCRAANAPSQVQNELTAMLGIVALRRGEIDNCIGCLGPSSCIFPIVAEAVHQLPDRSREAFQYFTAYLSECPGDLRVRWLLNIAAMTLGEYPTKVPLQHFIPLSSFQSSVTVDRFVNVAPQVGVTQRGLNLAGGSIFDDFTGDGLPDLFTTSLDADRGASFLVNRGDGSFADGSTPAGLDDQVYALNVTRADFNNDGYLDAMLLRGGWETPMRLSLLQNCGDGTFRDVSLESGIYEPIATEAAAWGDYDNDGLVDVYVCGEYRSPYAVQVAEPVPRNRCRLYRNMGGGQFEDVADQMLVTNEQCAKGATWGDYDGDGRLDLYVSNWGAPSRLYHNEGDSFIDMASVFGVTGPPAGFACMFLDYDNDGNTDLYANDFTISLAETAASALGFPVEPSKRSHLYRNLGASGFREVGREIGLTPFASMGCNAGDIDNDGFLDLYFGTGQMALEALVPNLLFKNIDGNGFANVTTSSGTGHLQKGHGVSFADWDCDGHLDLFFEVGGAVPGDKSYNVLFQNPGNDRHWLKLKLIGTSTDRAAIGTRIRITVTDPAGTSRSIFRTVGTNSSFGGNSLVGHIGLGAATSVTELAIMWPDGRSTQSFLDIAADQAIAIVEGADSFQPLYQPQIPISAERSNHKSQASNHKRFPLTQ
jgi:hypothetical protein